LGLRGLSVGGSVAGQELADPKFHPVWAKAEELGILILCIRSAPGNWSRAAA
jgi:aminocarboxymuconate-semialdehyde decarboxylase